MNALNAATRRLAALALAFATPLTHAVSLNPNGSGQVLIYPYYSVDNGRVTQISVVNGADRGKALRVQFAESRNGRSVLTFNLYVAAHDSWTGSVFSLGEGAANLVTDDPSCTYPEIHNGLGLPQLPDGRRYVAFRNAAYLDDSGPDTLDRTRQGTVEILELGSILPSSALADALMLDASGNPKNCDYLNQTWASTWTTAPSTGLANPTGGLRGNANLVDVAAGRLFGYDASALEDFRVDPTDTPRGKKSSVVMHTKPVDAHPNLADALTDPAKQIAAADVSLGGHFIHAEYPGTRAIDAVTATLMAQSIGNDYILDSSIGATTQWIVAMPTRPFYADAAVVGNAAIAPFTQIYPKSGDEKEACMLISHDSNNRNGTENSNTSKKVPVCRMTEEIAVAAVDFGFSDSALTVFKSAGSVQWDLSGQSEAKPHAMRPANDGTVFTGLPVLGFSEINFGAINAAGTSANYSSRSEHRKIVHCTNSAGKCD